MYGIDFTNFANFENSQSTIQYLLFAITNFAIKLEYQQEMSNSVTLTQ